ncbi:MAG: ATP-binding protein [bacterium]|nr:ATP-binding protein [bacterium]
MFGFKKKNTPKIKTSLSSDSQSILNAIDDGVIAIGQNGDIETINPAAQNMTGWSQADAFGLTFESVIKLTNSEGRELLPQENPIKKFIANPTPLTSREYFIKTQGGKNIPIFLHINPIDAQNSRFVVVFRNIAKEIQENREQTEFISTASHEMRTPVASIEGYLGLALNPATATIDARAKSYLEKAHENVKHLGQLFQDLLDITKAEDGRLKNEPVVLDAVEFSREVWDGLRAKAESKGLRYIFDLDENKSGVNTISPVFYIHSDRDHLREILNNLFENAIKYTPAGDVVVGVTGERDFVEISVKDSGIGIPREDIPHLFQKFYRVDNSATREIGGTGLGLYLSRKLAESLGGTLRVESEWQKGSVFILRLPRITREQAENFRAREIQKTEFQEKAKNLGEGFDLVNSTAEINIESREFKDQNLNFEETPITQQAPTQPVTQHNQMLAAQQVQLSQQYQAVQPQIVQQNYPPAQHQNLQQNYQYQPTQQQIQAPPQPAVTSQYQAARPMPTLAEIEASRQAYLQQMEILRQQQQNRQN